MVDYLNSLKKSSLYVHFPSSRDFLRNDVSGCRAEGQKKDKSQLDCMLVHVGLLHNKVCNRPAGPLCGCHALSVLHETWTCTLTVQPGVNNLF